MYLGMVRPKWNLSSLEGGLRGHLVRHQERSKNRSKETSVNSLKAGSQHVDELTNDLLIKQLHLVIMINVFFI